MPHSECHAYVRLEGFGTECGAPFQVKDCPFAGQVMFCGKPDRHFFVIAPSHTWFRNWCEIDMHLNSRDRRWVPLCDRSDIRSIHGKRARPGDKVIVLGAPEGGGMTDMLQELLRAGFTVGYHPDAATSFNL